MLRHVLIGAARAEVISGPLRLVQALRLDQLGVALLGWVPAVGPKLRQLVEFAPKLGRPIRRELAAVTPAQPVTQSAGLPHTVTQSAGLPHRRVAFFLGCMMNVAMPDVSRATVRVLTRAGCEVVTPAGQACCGTPQDDQAMHALSRELARRNIATFEPLLADVEAIVTAVSYTHLTLPTNREV